jgi:hypothetical protein
MTGIQFITDEKGRKTAAVIGLKKHRALWEDFEDVLVSRRVRIGSKCKGRIELTGMTTSAPWSPIVSFPSILLMVCQRSPVMPASNVRP